MGEGRLYVCGTPIGNLEDMTGRLQRVIGEVDLVYAEDTRRAAKLLSGLGVKAPVRSLFVGNEKARSAEVVDRLTQGLDVAYLSDAGMPGISDPGAWLVSLAREAGHPVTVVPGPSSVTAALVASGFPSDRFTFEGFLPRKGEERTARIDAIAADDRPTVIFVSPHRIGADLEDLCRLLGEDRQIAVARELTKLHEEVWVGPLGEARQRFHGPVKGEVTVVVSAATLEPVGVGEALEHARTLMAGGVSASEAARRAAKEMGVSRRAVYQALID